MNRKYSIAFLFLALCLLGSACGKEEGVASPDPIEKPSPDIEFEVAEGMDLVGIVTDAKTSQPIPGVVVSDGYTCAKTDGKGIYQLKRGRDAVFVYYSVPSQYEVNATKGIPTFYAKVDHSTPIFRKDFQLNPLAQPEDKFTLFCIADPQCKTDANIARFKDETIRDLQLFTKNYTASYGVTLGDIVFDTPGLFSSMKGAMNVENLKIFQTIGNHDHYENGTSEKHCIQNYQNTFGPTDYSFNRGKTHIVVMDNVIYNAKQSYDAGFSAAQVAWLKQDLAFVPKDYMVILCVHIPTRNSASVQRCKEVYDLMKPFAEAHVMSGHTHYNQNYKITTHGIYEHIHGAACGNWWSCTINGDGAPNGYGVYEIEGNHISNWFYKGTNLDQKEQIRMYPIGSFSDNTNNLVANIWNADEDWKVKVYENGVYTGDMERFSGYEKAVYQFFYQVMKKPLPGTPTGTTSWYRRPDHMFKYIPQSTDAKFEIRATDRFGNVYVQDQFVSDFKPFQSY